MATFNTGAYYALNMDTLNINQFFSYKLANASSTDVRLYNDPATIRSDFTHFNGTDLAFSPAGGSWKPTAGMMNSVRVVAGDQLSYELSGVNMEATAVYAYAQANNTRGFLEEALKGSDIVDGSRNNDVLHGFEDADTLTGNGGKDELWGDGGADIFDFNAVGDSKNGQYNRDVVYFETGADKIDLHDIDADRNTAGNQDFTLVSAFTGASGQLLFKNGMVQADVNGDGRADFEILVMDAASKTALSALSVDSFIL